MIRHIVMWKFREGTEEKANEFLTKLAALDGVIPQLKKSEVARNIGKDNYDAVLVSEFETMDDLNAYKVDPRHVAVSDICKSIRADRVAVDYEFYSKTKSAFRRSLFLKRIALRGRARAVGAHVCGARGVFSDAHVVRKNDLNFFAPAGAKWF